MPPAVAITAASFSETTRSRQARSWRLKVATPDISISSGMLAPYSCSTMRSSSMNGTPSFSASILPSVDLPAPRKPTSAIRRPRSARDGALDPPLDRFGNRRQIARRCTPQQIDDAGVGRGQTAGLRQHFKQRNFQRVGDGAHHQNGRIAGAALDLRQIALRRARLLGELAARHAALGAAEPHHAADLAGEGRVGTAGDIGEFAGIDGVRHEHAL